MENTHTVRDGMRVLGPNGEFLGYVEAVGAGHFELTPGIRHPSLDYDVPFHAVREIQRGHVVLRWGLRHLTRIDDDDGSCVPPRDSADIDHETLNLPAG